MARNRGSQDERRVQVLLETFQANLHPLQLFLNQIRDAITESQELKPHVHSVRWRLKDPDHLKDKLLRKIDAAKQAGKAFGITRENLLVRVTDLVGIRILHLYTRQIAEIDRVLRDIFAEQRFRLIEGPFARTWDDESRNFFSTCGIQTQGSPSMYTSVHYVIGSASRTKMTCEIQVRTLMEEVWGEVDHSINYPHTTESLACSEQLKVLARVTSSATRLVDSVFATYNDFNSKRSTITKLRGGSKRRAVRPERKRSH